MKRLQTLMTKTTGAFALVALAAGIIAAPSIASACGGGDIGCGVISEVVAIDSEEGVIGLQFRGAFAWTSGAGYGAITANTKISDPMLGFFETRCHMDDPNYVACQEQVRALVLAVQQKKPVSFMVWGGNANGVPFFLAQDGDTPDPVDLWNLPYALNDASELVVCRPALNLLHASEATPERATRPSATPLKASQPQTGNPISMTVVRPNVDLTALSVQAKADLDLPQNLDNVDMDADVAEDHHAPLAGCAAGGATDAGLGMGLVAWLMTLMVMAIRRRSTADVRS